MPPCLACSCRRGLLSDSAAAALHHTLALSISASALAPASPMLLLLRFRLVMRLPPASACGSSRQRRRVSREHQKAGPPAEKRRQVQQQRAQRARRAQRALTVASMAAPSSPRAFVSISSDLSAVLEPSACTSCVHPAAPMPFLLKSAAAQLRGSRREGRAAAASLVSNAISSRRCDGRLARSVGGEAAPHARTAR